MRRVAGSQIGKHTSPGPRVVFDVLEDKSIARAAEPVQSILDVGCVAGLGPLAIVHDVHPRLDLTRKS